MRVALASSRLVSPDVALGAHSSMPAVTTNGRQRRIIQISQEWGIVLPPTPTPLPPPPQAPSFRTPAHDKTAEELMQRRAADVAQYRPKSGLSRAFSSNNLKRGKNWDPREVLEVLNTWVANAGSPAVAEALIAKLAAAGVDLGGSQKQKSGLLNRRRSSESLVRQDQAVETGRRWQPIRNDPGPAPSRRLLRHRCLLARGHPQRQHAHG